MKPPQDLKCLRLLLIVLGLQKAVDALFSVLHPPIAYAILRVFGFDDIATDAPLHRLLTQLWGCASLAWAYVLLRAASDPRSSGIIVEGSALGFVAVGLVAVCTPLPWVRAVGILMFVEAVLLLMGRLRLSRPTTAP
jgi:hypothetical protein